MTAACGLEVPVFLKWPGGKRKVMTELGARLPDDFFTRRYLEPFVGGGALFFAAQPKEAVLSDINAELMNTYRWIRSDVEQVIAQLEVHALKNRKDRYYQLRQLFNSGELSGTAAQAALFIYLNKTCFNGIWRVSRNGFNVPYAGTTRPLICDHSTLRAASAALDGIALMEVPFTEALSQAGIRDFVYLDPPYIPVSPTSNFTGYAVGGFGDDDHKLLAETCRRLHDRGAKFMLSNSDHPWARRLYDGFRIEVIASRSSVGAAAESRKVVNELIVRNY